MVWRFDRLFLLYHTAFYIIRLLLYHTTFKNFSLVGIFSTMRINTNNYS